MYLPKHFAVEGLEPLRELIRTHSFATLVTVGDQGLMANHLPLLLDADGGEHGILRGHVARANPVWQQLAQDREVLVIFQGPQTYISPKWYASKREHGKVVPTWNYAAVHAHGHARAIEDPQWLLDLVTRLTDAHEASDEPRWKVDDAPADYVQSMLQAIVGIEIAITRIEGKWKVSQNRPPADIPGIVEGLKSRRDESSRAMAELVERFARRPAVKNDET